MKDRGKWKRRVREKRKAKGHQGVIEHVIRTITEFTCASARMHTNTGMGTHTQTHTHTQTKTHRQKHIQ